MRRAFAFLLLCAPACRPPEAPTGALLAYARALRADRPQAAWALLASDAQRRTTPERFKDAWRRLPADERQREAERLERAAREGRWIETAQASAGNRTALLTRDPEGWRLVSPRPSGPAALTAEGTVAAWVAALEARDLRQLLGLLTPELRAQLERELTARLAAYRDLKSRLQVEGDRARLEGDFPLDLVRDPQGQWHVADIH